MYWPSCRKELSKYYHLCLPLWELLDWFQQSLRNYGISHSGRQLLHWAALGGHEDLTSFLIEHGLNVDVVDDSRWTSLIIAASAGRKQVVRLLIGRGADINAVNQGGHSSLQYASSKNHYEIVEILIQNGADVNLADKLGATALHRAASKNNIRTMELLLRCNDCHIDPINCEGNTPLHLACEEEHLEAARLLVQNGARDDIRNKEEKTPIDLSRTLTISSINSH